MNWAQRAAAGPFLTRLRHSPGFGAADFAAIANCAADIRTVEHHGTIIAEGRRDDRLHVVLDGWAARVRILKNGSRQIPALVLAGDVADLHALHLRFNDCSTIALTRCTVAAFAHDHLQALFDRHRGLRDAIYRMMAVENSIGTQWTVCLGRRSARERLAHLLCELFVRLDAIAAAGKSGYKLPLTQEELADVFGLTAVHVNRTLQALRSEGLIRLKDHALTIPDWSALARAGGFDGGYLHCGADCGPSRASGRPTVAGGDAQLGT